ncbi:MAG: YdcH family protein [Pseudomonadota bacterium]
MDETEIRQRIESLVEEHRDLDYAIVQLVSNPGSDQLKLRRLKQRKLRLKDQIAWWESQLIPDLGA